MPDFVSNEEIVLAARKNLIQGTWDYLVGGSESETTLRRNRQAFDKVAFRPRILVDVSKIDTSTTFLGQNMRIPAMLAPVGSLQVFTPEGGVAAATGSEGVRHAALCQLGDGAIVGGHRSRRHEVLPALRARRRRMAQGLRRAHRRRRLRGAGDHGRHCHLQPPRAPDAQPLEPADARRHRERRA